MQIASLLRIFGLVLICLSFTFVPPLLFECWDPQNCVWAFTQSFGYTLGSGFVLWLLFRNQRHILRTHACFLGVILFLSGLSAFCALPFWLMPSSLTLTDALFESISGITTTGATIMTHLEGLPRSILYYRQQLQLIGGVSIVTLAVAIYPLLGIGGMQFLRSEVENAEKEDKYLLHIIQTSKTVLSVYLFLTIMCCLAYCIAGMSWFDALCHSFSTISTGGFSTHQANFTYFDSPHIKVTAIVFMLLGAMSFLLHFAAVKRRQFSLYMHNPELRFFIKLTIIVTLLLIFSFVLSSHPFTQHPILDTAFQVVSMATTTGYLGVDIAHWPLFASFTLICMSIMGGCSGSTAGGIKTIRVMILQKQSINEMHRLIHPHGQYPIKFGHMLLSDRIVESVWAYFALSFGIILLLLIILLMVEPDFLTAFTAILTAFTNSGRGLGHIVHTFSGLSDYAKWILSFAMIVARLEVLTVLLLFSPTFWRR